MPENMFCNHEDIHNEADVEQIFARRMIEYLGYKDSQIRPKDSLSKLTIGGLRGNVAKYRPDFAIKVGTKVCWILEAKSPDENLDNHGWQPRGYCTLINGQYKDENPAKYFVLSNGTLTRLFQWDVNDPILELSFTDFQQSNSKFAKLISLLSAENIAHAKSEIITDDYFTLTKMPIEEVNTAFAWCHQTIYKKDNISQAAAFTEFVKVIFLKLLSDKRIRDKYPNVLIEESIEVPNSDVKFSIRWIEIEEKNTPNPLDSIQFRDFIKGMERDIVTGSRKRIFDSGEHINLTPETIKSVIRKIENFYLFGIDADINGRLFETFLNATMRGKDLGQYFTPRSVVKLGTKLANLKVHILQPSGVYHTDVVVDACCGTGGFLIDALAHMWDKVNNNSSLSDSDKSQIRERIANHHIFGIDVGRVPPLARIARLNMFLHGDGGGSIYQADALDKEVSINETDDPEIVAEKKQLRKLFNSSGFADIILTNPPFAKTYERASDRESQILDGYRLSYKEGGDKRPSLKSNLMFVERYHDLLKPGGQLITVIDDGVLSGRNYKWFRKFIRESFIIKAVISLPGDAFQRSKARVKTSLLVLEKRTGDEIQKQSSVFMYGSEYVGIDDPSRRRTLPIDAEIKQKAIEEIDTIEREYESFLSGSGNSEYVVPAEKIQDRLDVKSCLMKTGRKIKEWKSEGIEILSLSNLVDEKEYSEEDIIETKYYDDFVTYLRVRYDGFAEAGDEILSSDTQYSQLYRIAAGNLVISNIAATYGSVAIVSEDLAGCVVTSEYTVLVPKEDYDPRIIWLLLRSPEIRSDMLLMATGANRTRISWDIIKDLLLPYPTSENVELIASLLREAEEAERIAKTNRINAIRSLETPLDLDNEKANSILRAFKPPK